MLAWVFAVAGVVVLLALLWWAHVRYWARRLALPVPYASTESLATTDGAHIELRHLPPSARATRTSDHDLPPVILVHGLGANHRNVDLHPDHSLARELAAGGRDVWLVTLRSGVGIRGLVSRRRVRFAAMVAHDVPLAVDAVCDRTGARRVDYVGFSMGGMLLFSALGRTVAAARVRRAVLIGAPGRIAPPVGLFRVLGVLPRWLVPGLPLRLLARTVAFLAERIPPPFHRKVSNPDNTTPVLARLALVNLVEDVPAALQAELAGWAFADGEIRLEGERVLDRLAGIEVPALFFAGTRDQLAPLESVRAVYEAWGAARPDVIKELRVLGTAYGAHADYGHGDMTVGPHVRADLFRPVAAFLAAPAREHGRPPGVATTTG